MAFESGHAPACNVPFGRPCNCSVGKAKEHEDTIVRAVEYVEKLKAQHAAEVEALHEALADLRRRAVDTCRDLGVKYQSRPPYERCAKALEELPLID